MGTPGEAYPPAIRELRGVTYALAMLGEAALPAVKKIAKAVRDDVRKAGRRKSLSRGRRT